MAQRTCDVDGCERSHRARGLCQMHWKREYGTRTKYPIACQVCSVEWLSDRKDGRFCSDTCKGDAYRKTYSRALVIAEGGWCALASTHVVMRYGATQRMSGRWWTEFVSGPCEWCQTAFTAGTTNTARFCSDICAASSMRARRGRFVIPAWRRAAIYERDGWICQLCMDPVDSDLPTSDAWAATLDHIRCQSWTDEPDHSDDNLRLAHRWCNSVRGDESKYSLSDLRIS